MTPAIRKFLVDMKQEAVLKGYAQRPRFAWSFSTTPNEDAFFEELRAKEIIEKYPDVGAKWMFTDYGFALMLKA